MKDLEDQIPQNSDEKTIRMLKDCLLEVIKINSALIGEKNEVTRTELREHKRNFLFDLHSLLKRRGLKLPAGYGCVKFSQFLRNKEKAIDFVTKKITL